MKTTFTQDWKDWITLNVKNGQPKDGLFKILLDDGFEFSAIVNEMKYVPSVPIEQLVNPFHAAAKEQGHNVLSQNQKTTGQGNNNSPIKVKPNEIYIANSERLVSDKLELYSLENFLNKEECEHLISFIDSEQLSSKTITTDNNYQYNCWNLDKNAEQFISEIDNRICRLIGIDESYSEAIESQYHEINHQLVSRSIELFEKDQNNSSVGESTYTILIFLNDVPKGGEITFSNTEKEFKPEQGKAIIWNNRLANGSINPDSWYSLKPVIEGCKNVIVKRFYTNSRLPSQPKMWTKEENEFVPNLTEVGFKKSRLPDVLFEKIKAFYHGNRSKNIAENVPGDFIFSKNNNKQSTVLVELTNELRTEIHDAMKPMVEEWCEQKLEPSYVYGIRIYNNKAQLKLHRDRVETHILGVIINVDQEVNEDWPLEIEDNYYRKHEVMLKPGDVVFYESARLTHGRPTPFNGKSFANIFCHFYPTGYQPRKF